MQVFHFRVWLGVTVALTGVACGGVGRRGQTATAAASSSKASVTGDSWRPLPSLFARPCRPRSTENQTSEPTCCGKRWTSMPILAGRLAIGRDVGRRAWLPADTAAAGNAWASKFVEYRQLRAESPRTVDSALKLAGAKRRA